MQLKVQIIYNKINILQFLNFIFIITYIVLRTKPQNTNNLDQNGIKNIQKCIHDFQTQRRDIQKQLSE